MTDLLAEVHGCTFDDFLFSPHFGVLERRDPRTIDLSSRLSEHLTLKHPIVSANMDTITRAAMAIVQAEEGGIGIIDRGFRGGDIAAQVREVEVVKRTQHGVIPDPYTIGATASLREATETMERSGVGTLVVVDGDRKLRGLLTTRDARFVGGQQQVGERMTPLDKLVLHEGDISLDEAERVMAKRKIKKLPLVGPNGVLTGLITSRDIVHQKRLPFASRDAQGRLRVGAAIGAKGDFLERAAELIRAGVDVLVIDIAHGHSVVMAKAVEAFRAKLGDFEMIAGNVATAEGARYLAERGVNGIKVGIGPGGGCTTRLNTNFGVPQLQALVECQMAVGDRVPLIADGGIRRDGGIIEALLFGGDTVMLGNAFAGTTETPGETVHKSVVLPESQKVVRVPFKVFRGMASIGAMVDRLDVEDSDAIDVDTLGAEGLEVSVPLRGSVRPVIAGMLKHLCSSISYGGASSLGELRKLFWDHPEQYIIKLSASGRRESFER
ncbi:MAG TPA: IMP dehydrogenase [Vicinamibacterales bacterium]|jgi:IMP dehydrogenase|nr:IMP dehydrogenase [Vicinamibacterales bacterium]